MIWIAVHTLERIFQCPYAGEWPISVLIAVEQNRPARLRRARRLGPAEQFPAEARRNCDGSSHTSSLEECSAGQHGGILLQQHSAFSTQHLSEIPNPRRLLPG